MLDNKYLAHRSHKYIRKEFVNGRWRYYYKDSSGRDYYTKGADIHKHYVDPQKSITEFYSDLGGEVGDAIDDALSETSPAYRKAKRFIEAYLNTPIVDWEIWKRKKNG